MKKILTVCTILLAITCVVFAAGKTVVAPPVQNMATHETLQNQPVVPTEYDLAKANFIRKQEGSILSKDEAALVDKYFGSRGESGGSLDNVGGPDGYSMWWRDNVSDTVVYNWIELCADGSASVLSASGDDVDASIPLGLTFPYYGNTYTTADVSSNGQVTFGTTQHPYSNACQDATGSLYYLNVYWDDMLTVAGTPGTCTNGVVYYKNFGSYTVIEYHLLDPFSGTGLTSCEAILWGTTATVPGLIKYQWHLTEYTHTSASATIGIEAPGALGLQYICNTAGIVGGRAVVFYRYIPPSAELGVSNLAPCGTFVPGLPPQTVSFRVTNNGGGASSACTGYYTFDGGATQSAPIPIIQPSSFFDVFFSVPVNLTNGSHTLSGWFLPHDNPSGNDSASCAANVPRPCANCTPADYNLDPVSTTPFGSTVSGNCGNGGKWDGSFTAVAGCTYHWDLCPDAPGAGTANFDIDIKITDANCNILTGQDGSCVALSYRPNDFQWTAPTSGTYYVILAPYYSYTSHTCTGTAASTFTMQYYMYCAPSCTIACQSNDLLECAAEAPDSTVQSTDCDGGCNNINPLFGQIACGQTVCGLGFTYLTPGGLQYRDTDWYLFTIAQDETVSVSARAEFPLLIGIVSGVNPCSSPAFVVSATNTNLCSLTVAQANCLPAGTYAMFVAPNVFTGLTTPMHYRATLNCFGVCLPCPFPNLDVEPVNNTCGPDAPQITCNASYCGLRSPGTDVDFYKLVLTERDTVKINVFANVSVGHWPQGKGLDSYVTLLDANCTVLMYDDDFNGVAPDPQGFDSGLRPGCLDAGTYYIEVAGFSTSVGPYELNVLCAPCYSVCVPDQQVTLNPDNPHFPNPQTSHVCAHLAAGVITQVVVPIHNDSNLPVVTITPGCPDCDDPTCRPLNNWQLGAWLYQATPPAYVATLTTFETVGCCVCIHLDYVLPVNLRTFDGVPGDNSVNLTWTTASENNASHFEITRDGLLTARVTATNTATGSTYRWTDASAQNGTTYHYSLVAVSVNGNRQDLGNVAVTPSFEAAVITVYALHQNYPNPFNPTTSIALDLVDNGFVTLKVYNLMGQEVASLVNGNMDKGRHIVSFDASSLSSGVYLYRLSVNGFVAEKKMLLMK